MNIRHHLGILTHTTVSEHAALLVPHARALATHAADENSPYSFLWLPAQTESLHACMEGVIAPYQKEQPDIIILAAIGGSAMGTRAVFDYCKHHLPRAPELWCADTIDPITTTGLLAQCDAAIAAQKKILLIIVSKSGITTETVTNAHLFLEKITNQHSALYRSPLVITDERSPLWHQTQQKKWSCLTIPSKLGGRFSIWSAASLAPLMLLGIDTGAMLDGARHITQQFCEQLSAQNPTLYTAALFVAAYEQGLVINDTFICSPHLMSYALWYRQLLGESLGKKIVTESGVVQRYGITPTVSVIAQDLHAAVQLYLDGPRRTCTTFIESPCSGVRAGLHNQAQQHIIEDVHSALIGGIQQAYQHEQLPYESVTLSPCGAYSLGALMQRQMIAITLTGYYWGIDPFNQPAVQLYNKYVSERLA